MSSKPTNVEVDDLDSAQLWSLKIGDRESARSHLRKWPVLLRIITEMEYHQRSIGTSIDWSECNLLPPVECEQFRHEINLCKVVVIANFAVSLNQFSGYALNSVPHS